MFKECGIIERYGSGIRRIIDACKNHGVSIPVIKEFQHGFMVTLYKTVQETAQESTKEMILELLKQNPHYTRQDLVSLLNKADGTISEHLANLKKAGLLKRVGSTKGGHWKVV